MDFKWVTGDEREALYNEIWTEPVTIVAKRYGISDVGLRKHCKRLGIPLPSAGYWSKVRAGQTVPKPPLPKVTGELRRFVRNYVIKYQADVESLSDSELQAAHDLSLLREETRDFIRDTCSNLKVAGKLRDPHNLIKQHMDNSRNSKKRDCTRDSSTTDRVYRRNEMLSSPEIILPITVSPGQINRAYRILDTLMKAIDEMEGYTSVVFYSGQGKAYFLIMHTAFYYELKESTSKQKSEKGDKLPPALVLSLTAQSYFNEDITQYLEFRDSADTPLETQVGRIIYDMFIIGNRFRAADELANRAERRAWEEEERKRRLEGLRRGELEEISLLEQAASDWEKAQIIRRFADCAELQINEVTEGSKREKLLNWLKWARQKADWLDPLTAKEDELLGKNKHLFERIDEDDL